MIKYLRKWFRKIEYVYKERSIQLIISISFSALAILFAAIMEFATYSNFVKNARESAIYSNQQVLNQLNWNLHSYIRNMMSVSDSMYYNVIKNKDLTWDTVDSEMSLLYEANKDSLVSIALISQDGALIEAAPVATRKAGVDFKKLEWFKGAEEKIENLHFSIPHVQNMFESSNFRYYWVVSLSRSVDVTYNGNIQRGVLLVDMNFNSIEQMFERVNTSDAGYVYLMDSNGEIIYHPLQKAISSGIEQENNIVASGYDDGNHIETFMGEERSVIVKTVGYTGWKIVGVVPVKDLTVDSQQVAFITIFIFTVTIILMFFGNLFISSIVTDPIRQLEESLVYLESGNLDEDAIYHGGTHEIRHLSNTIKSMVRQMRKLMDDMVREQEEKTKSELDALQSQINPHFLYNTLDSVVWMVESERYQEAIFMVTSLASLFRISLSKGNNIISIKDEITHATNYLNIQKVRFKNKFEYSIDVDPEIMDCKTIKLIIQPLVENAIYYGVGNLDDEGEITIKGYEKDGDIYIEVTDNGMGIPPETVDKLLKEKSKSRGKGSGIGLWNVNQRINLYFKGDYGLSIQSELDEGTTVTIHLPKVMNEESEVIADER